MIYKLKHTTFNSSQSGSIMIALLIFIIVGTMITTASVMLMIDNTVISTEQIAASEVHGMAESGVENAILRLLRDPSYTGETLIVGEGQVVVSVAGSNPIVVTSEATLGSSSRTIVANLERNSGILTIDSWE